jgi:hypothetical protein
MKYADMQKRWVQCIRLSKYYEQQIEIMKREKANCDAKIKEIELQFKDCDGDS